MACEYLIKENGKVFCRVYGRLEEWSKEKISECESNFDTCSREANKFLKRKRYEQRGIGEHFVLGPLDK